jgi:uncharacterized membrane protein YhaH (DUF805 family)
MMSTSSDQEGPSGPSPERPGQWPGQASPDQAARVSPAPAQGTYAQEEDIPRQSGWVEDTHSDYGNAQYFPSQAPDTGATDAGSAGAGAADSREADARGRQQAYVPYPPSGGDASGAGDYAGAGSGASGYLEGGPADFGEAVSRAFRHMFTYRGRASRSAFWWLVLFVVFAEVIIGIVARLSRPAGIGLDIVVGIPNLLVGLSMAVRRLHDTGRSGWWWWLYFLPVIGWITLLVFYLLPGTPGRNRYSTGRLSRRAAVTTGMLAGDSAAGAGPARWHPAGGAIASRAAITKT